MLGTPDGKQWLFIAAHCGPVEWSGGEGSVPSGEINASYEYFPADNVTSYAKFQMCVNYFDREAADYDYFDKHTERRTSIPFKMLENTLRISSENTIL